MQVRGEALEDVGDVVGLVESWDHDADSRPPVATAIGASVRRPSRPGEGLDLDQGNAPKANRLGRRGLEEVERVREEADRHPERSERLDHLHEALVVEAPRGDYHAIGFVVVDHPQGGFAIGRRSGIRARRKNAVDDPGVVAQRLIRSQPLRGLVIAHHQPPLDVLDPPRDWSGGHCAEAAERERQDPERQLADRSEARAVAGDEQGCGPGKQRGDHEPSEDRPAVETRHSVDDVVGRPVEAQNLGYADQEKGGERDHGPCRRAALEQDDRERDTRRHEVDRRAQRDDPAVFDPLQAPERGSLLYHGGALGDRLIGGHATDALERR